MSAWSAPAAPASSTGFSDRSPKVPQGVALKVMVTGGRSFGEKDLRGHVDHASRLVGEALVLPPVGVRDVGSDLSHDRRIGSRVGFLIAPDLFVQHAFANLDP